MRRLEKVQKAYERTSRYQTSLDERKTKRLRELFIGDQVLVLASRIKKRDAPTAFTKASTNKISPFNRKTIYEVRKKIKHRESKSYIYYYYWVKEHNTGKIVNERFSRKELFALVSNFI